MPPRRALIRHQWRASIDPRQENNQPKSWSGLHDNFTVRSPKGLRHGFGIKAVTSAVPLNMVQKWLGHAQLSTTAIYADASGSEATQLAKRMW
jgi:site-specific recombinase XerD